MHPKRPRYNTSLEVISSNQTSEYCPHLLIPKGMQYSIKYNVILHFSFYFLLVLIIVNSFNLHKESIKFE